MALDDADLLQIAKLIEGTQTANAKALADLTGKIPSADSISKLVSDGIAAFTAPGGSGTPAAGTPAAGTPAAGTSAAGTPAAGAVDPQIAGKIADLERQLKTAANERKADVEARTKAEARELKTGTENAVTQALSTFTFVDDEARQDAFSAILGRVQRTEDGQFVVDNLPVTNFASTFIPEKKSYLLKPLDVAGGGANGGQQRHTAATAAQIEEITPNMTDDQKKRVYGSIVAALPR